MSKHWTAEKMRYLNLDRWREPSTILRYGLPVLAVAAGTIVAHQMAPVRFAVTPSFLCAVLLSAWFGGTGPGLLATALSVLALDYYFLPPIKSFAIEAAYIPPLTLFSLASIFVTWLSARERKTAKSLETSNQSLQAEIAAREQAEEEMHRLRTELAHVNRIMTLGELTASIAHEINQPLTAVVTDASAASRWLDRQSPDLDEALRAIARIRENGNRAADVIHHIRELVKRAPVQMSQVDINEVILSVIAVTRSEMERNCIAFRTELGTGLPSVRGDRVHLQQVVLNLIVNAIEAMSATARRDLLVCSRQRVADNVLVSVCDSGSGLDPEKLDRLFEAFYTTKAAGMGMGLAICHSIMERHGGRLSARANEPYGAIFEVELPIEQINAIAA